MKWIARYSSQKTHVQHSEGYLLLARAFEAKGIVALLSLKARGKNGGRLGKQSWYEFFNKSS